MKTNTLKRLSVAILIGLLLGAVISELSYSLTRETSRPAERIELIIPHGTAEQVARGDLPPSIPEEMTFVVGDTLVVYNQDVVDHQLGPVWIPAGLSASMELGQVEKFTFQCSFQPTQYFGLDVREPLTLGTRLQGILMTGIPLGILLGLYSIAWPHKSKTS
jgi:hypothetical protein